MNCYIAGLDYSGLFHRDGLCLQSVCKTRQLDSPAKSAYPKSFAAIASYIAMARHEGMSEYIIIISKWES